MLQPLAQNKILPLLKLRHEHWAGLGAGLGFLIIVLRATGKSRHLLVAPAKWIA
jgi:hypothetical protein